LTSFLVIAQARKLELIPLSRTQNKHGTSA
jgi:hypothetical protein